MESQTETYAKPTSDLKFALYFRREKIIEKLKIYRLSNYDRNVFKYAVIPEVEGLFLSIRSEYTNNEEDATRIEKILLGNNAQLILKEYNKIDRWLKEKKLISYTHISRME